MISIFNGRQRSLGQAEAESVYVQIDVAMREHLHAFKGAPLAVFLCIALHANAEGWSRPSIERIAEFTGYTKHTVSDAIRDLTEIRIDGHAVLLSAVVRLQETSTRFASNWYLIFPSTDDLATWAPFSPYAESPLVATATRKLKAPTPTPHVKKPHAENRHTETAPPHAGLPHAEKPPLKKNHGLTRTKIKEEESSSPKNAAHAATGDGDGSVPSGLLDEDPVSHPPVPAPPFPVAPPADQADPQRAAFRQWLFIDKGLGAADELADYPEPETRAFIEELLAGGANKHMVVASVRKAQWDLRAAAAARVRAEELYGPGGVPPIEEEPETPQFERPPWMPADEWALIYNPFEAEVWTMVELRDGVLTTGKPHMDRYINSDYRARRDRILAKIQGGVQ